MGTHVTRAGTGGTSRQRLRVLWVYDHAGREPGGVHGASQYFANLVEQFNTNHIDLTLSFLGRQQPVAGVLHERGVQPIFFGRAKWDPRAFTDLFNLVSRERYDVLHLGGMKSILLGRMVAQIVGAKAFIHLHDTRPLPAWLRLAERGLAAATDVAVGVSEAARQYAVDVLDVPPTRAVVLHTGIPVEKFAQPDPDARDRVRRELGIPTEAPVVGMVGRMSVEKGHALVVRNMPALVSRCPGTSLLIVGDGETRALCEQVAHDLGVEQAISFAGQRTDLPSVFAAIDVLAMPGSIGAPFSLTPMEAIAAGRPVVAFDHEGMDELINHAQTGLLIEPSDENAFTAALARLLNDAPLRHAMREACERASQRFSIREHVTRLEHLYDAAVLGQTDAIEAIAMRS